MGVYKDLPVRPGSVKELLISASNEWVPLSWRKILETTVEHSLRKYCITMFLTTRGDKIGEESQVLVAERKRDSEELASEVVLEIS